MSGRSGSVRIIAGRWRGRRLRFPASAGLRPTSDRRRETLFNWLGADLSGLRCLDLFAGSGALGFEAASRGAARVVLVEAARPVVRALEGNRVELDAGNVEIHALKAERYLARGPDDRFDLVFIDPPFTRSDLATKALSTLRDHWLAPAARIYIEVDARLRAELPMAPEWHLHREMNGGDARGLLYATDD